MTKYLIGASFIALFAFAEANPAQAQQSTLVATCGAQSISAGQSTSGTYIDRTGNLCTNATGGTGSNASVGTNGAASPGSTTQVGSVDGGGNLQPASTTNPIPVIVSSLPLPPAAATSANQATEISSLAAIATNSALALPAQSGHGVNIGGVEGVAASGATDSDNPLNGGGRTATAAPTAVTDGQKVANLMGETGKQVVLPYSIKETAVRGTTTSTDTAAHTIIASAGGSLKNYITGLQCGRTDAGATAITLTISDAAASVFILPAGGATNIQFSIPLATAAATAFSVTSGTGVSTLYCSAQGFTGL